MNDLFAIEVSSDFYIVQICTNYEKEYTSSLPFPLFLLDRVPLCTTSSDKLLIIRNSMMSYASNDGASIRFIVNHLQYKPLHVIDITLKQY